MQNIESITTKIKLYILPVFLIVFLTLNFYNNFFKVVDDEQFYFFQKDSESLVIGRLIHAQGKGILSDAGLTGRYLPQNVSNIFAYQYNMYLDEIRIDNKEVPFGTYDTQTGGQGIFFSILDKILPLNNLDTLKFFYFLTSFLTALIFTVFLQWTKKFYGSYTSIVSFCFIILSPWLTVFGNNLWWSLWSFYLPFVIFMYLLYNDKKNFKDSKKLQVSMSYKLLFLISFVLIFIKCFFTGFEYITTTLIMSGLPFIFYSIYNQWKRKQFYKNIFAYSVGAISSVLFSCIVLSIQLSIKTGDISKGYHHLIHAIARRSSGSGQDVSEVYRSSLQSNIFDVISIYWKGDAFSILPLSFGQFFYILLIFSALGLISEDISKKTYQNRRKNIALIVTTLISIFAPLSWFIIFKGHSYIHTHMNFIVWYMPYMLLVFAVIGSISSTLIQDFYSYIIKKNFTSQNKT